MKLNVYYLFLPCPLCKSNELAFNPTYLGLGDYGTEIHCCGCGLEIKAYNDYIIERWNNLPRCPRD